MINHSIYSFLVLVVELEMTFSMLSKFSILKKTIFHKNVNIFPFGKVFAELNLESAPNS